jgi:outer membrane protein TolC
MEECFKKARANYPLIRQYNLIEQSKNYELSNLQKVFLPQITMNAQANYQTDVITLPIDMPGIPTMSKDQYKATIDINQTIWDGGMVKSQKELSEASSNVELQNIEVEMYPLTEQVCNLYLGILMIDEQLKQLDILKENLEVSLNIANSMQKNGIALASDIDILNVEILNTLQKKTEAIQLKTSYTEMLASLINEPVSSAMLVNEFQSSLPFAAGIATINRPEISLFERQINLLDARGNVIDSKNMPRFSLFVQGGYGKPGLNMLSDRFDFFGIGGVRLSWNFGNLYTKNNEKRIVNIDKEKVKTREETLKFNINRQLLQVINEIDLYRELMKSDDEIIILREKVRTASEKKYNNGIYTVNDLIKDINTENISRQNKALHEIQYLMRVYKYKIELGEL